jgi:hypothetical protein
VEAHRPHSTSGLYALISADPAELRRELDNATPGRATLTTPLRQGTVLPVQADLQSRA